MSENLFGLTVAADKGLDDLQCQRDCAKPKKGSAEQTLHSLSLYPFYKRPFWNNISECYMLLALSITRLVYLRKLYIGIHVLHSFSNRSGQ